MRQVSLFVERASSSPGQLPQHPLSGATLTRLLHRSWSSQVLDPRPGSPSVQRLPAIKALRRTGCSQAAVRQRSHQSRANRRAAISIRTTASRRNGRACRINRRAGGRSREHRFAVRLARSKNRRGKNDHTDRGNRERDQRRRKNDATFHDDLHIGMNVSITEISYQKNVTDWCSLP